VVIVLIFSLIIKWTTPDITLNKDLSFLIEVSLFFLGGALIIIILDRYLSYNTASIAFTLLVTICCFISDSPTELVYGRSLISLLLPVVFAGFLMRSWAGPAMAALVSTFIVGVSIFVSHAWPNFIAIAIIVLVALVLWQMMVNMEQTVRKLEQTQHTLQNNEERFRTLIEGNTDINAILARDGILKYISPSIEQLLGYKVEDLIGRNIFNFIHPQDASRVVDALGTEVPAEALGPMLIVRLFHKNGSMVTVESLGKEMYNNPAINGAVINLRNITERKKMEDALRDSEEKFARAFQLTPMPMVISDPDGMFVEVNQAFVTLMGYSREEVIGRPRYVTQLGVKPEQGNQSLKILKDQGSLRDYEMDVRTRSGEVRHGRFFSETLRINDIPLVLTLMNDVTERKEMEYNLRTSEEKYRRLITTLPIGVIVHEGGQIRIVNQAAVDIIGARSPEELYGSPIMDLIHPDSREVVRSRIQATQGEGEKVDYIYEKILRVDGGVIDADVIAMQINLDGKPSRLILFSDVTKRKQAENALKKSEENFRNLSENTAEGIVIVAPDGSHLYANRKACQMFQIRPDEVLHTSLKDFADPASFPQLKTRLQDRLAGRDAPANYETVIVRKDGTRFQADITATRTTWQDQVCDLVIFRDITDRKQAQEAIRLQNQRIQEVSRQLVEAQEREKRMLASELHDDLGQSLTSLKLMLELANSTRPPSKNQKIMGDAQELVSELMVKVRNLSLDLRPAMLDDFGLFPALRWLFERFHDQTGISIHCIYPLDSVQRFNQPVETAAFRIIQEALTNIARHAGVREAKVKIAIGQKLSIEIADKGSGFNYAGRSNKWANSSGISGMQERARLLGGRVDIHSNIGEGTLVVAELPLEGSDQ